MTTVEQGTWVFGDPMSTRLTCIEVGASGIQTTFLDEGELVHSGPGAAAPDDQPLLIAVPGLVSGKRVLAASNLGWYDVDPARMLGLDRPADLVCNDAEAAALGESVLRRDQPDLVFIGLGTGVGGAVVSRGAAQANLFAHGGEFSDVECTCGRIGCLETVAAGWALPDVLAEEDLQTITRTVATAVRAEPHATPHLVVLAGGLTAAYPQLIGLLAAALPDREVVGTAAPRAKSAAAWGLRHLFDLHTPTATHF